MSAARWSLRLPRAAALSPPNVVQRRIVKRVSQQKRWLAERPPPRQRPWAGGRQQNNTEDGQIMAPSGEPENTRPVEQQQDRGPGPNTKLAATLQQSDTTDLITEVRIPDDIHGVLPHDHPALSILGNSSLVIQRQIEMMNLLVGFEVASKFIIMDGQGQTLGYIAETDHGMGSAMARQVFKTHRSFTINIFDRDEKEILRIHRPFAYINSRIRIYDPVPEGGYESMENSTALQGTSAGSAVNPGHVAQVSPLKLEEMRIIGEAQQQWAPLRRKYNLFTYRPLEVASDQEGPTRIESGDKPTTETTALTEAKVPDQAIEAGMSQFAHVNEPFLSWDFTMKSADDLTIGSVNRNFAGFAREIFTDTGVYAVRMDSAAQASALQDSQGQELDRYERDATAMTLDQRAVSLATAVSIDFDYFSRHSHVGGGGFMPLWFPGMGGGAAAEGAGAAGGAAAGGAEAGAASGAIGAAEGAGAMEGAATGVATQAGRGLSGAAAGESAIAGAGTMAGYEAMQRGVYGSRGDDASPTSNEPFEGAQSPGHTEHKPDSDTWGEDQDPWSGGGGGWPSDGPPPSAPGGGGGGGGEGGGGGGWLDSISEFFGD